MKRFLGRAGSRLPGWLRSGRLRWYIVGGLVAAVVAVVAVVLWWPESGEETGPRARQYRDYDICLLTPAVGLADAQAAAVWAGAQEVSLARGVRVLYQAVSGEQTPARASQLLASLVVQDCEVIVAVGPAPVAAASADESLYPGSSIVRVGAEIDDASSAAITRSTIDVLSALTPVD